MEEKKRINSNYCILIIILFAVVCFFVSFVVFNELKKNKNGDNNLPVIEDKKEDDTSVKTNVVDKGNDAQNAVNISMTPTEAKNGAVTVELTHNLGSAAALGYDEKASVQPVTTAFWDSIQTQTV